MLGWVITCHGELAQEMLDSLESRFGPLTQCRAVNFRHGLSTNMLSRMICDALHETDSGDGVVFLTDISGAAPYRAASLMSHKHEHCEVISGVDASCWKQCIRCVNYAAAPIFVSRLWALARRGQQSLASAAEKSAVCVVT
jgi:PTS system ascorbate-specific IIA component